MTVELITGQGASAHIGSEDVGAYQAHTFGTGCYVLHGCEAEAVDANTIRIKEGELLVEGRHVRVKGSEDISIQSGQPGYKRNDLIVVRYTKDTEGIEDAPLSAIVGAPVEGTPVDPSYIQGSILSGDVAAEFPLYRIPLDGINVGEPECLFERGSKIVAEGVSGGWKYRKWASGLAECWQTITLDFNSWKAWGSVYETDVKTARSSFPFAFKGLPGFSVSATSQLGGIMSVEVNGLISETSTPEFFAIRPTTVSGSEAYDIYMNVYVWGEWK